MKQKKFLFACGGTGGHVFPAIAIAESLKKLGVENISFAGRKDSMESRLVSPHFDFDEITAVPLHRGSFMRNLSLPFNLIKAMQSAKSVLKKRKPDVVVATGGYVSLPVVMAAGLAKIPVYIQEQNAVAGIANKVGARVAKKIFVTSEDARKYFPNTETLVFGNPVRELPKMEELVRPAEFGEGTKSVLVVGGSQGARGINQKMEEALPEIAKRKDVSVVWQAGAKNVDAIRERISIPENVTLTAFLDNIYSYMGYADLIVSRAGASTLAEILSFGKPSILFPFPFATANHQESNARVLEKAGAALVELDGEPNGLWNKVERLLSNGEKLASMAEKAKSIGMPDAADRIAKIILDAEG